MDKSKIDEILKPGTLVVREKRERGVRRKFWKTLAKAANTFPQGEEIVAAYYCALDPKTSMKVRGTLLAALAYFVLPMDFVPDFLVGIGFTDDLAVLMTAITTVKSAITDGHRGAAKTAIQRYLPENDDQDAA